MNNPNEKIDLEENRRGTVCISKASEVKDRAGFDPVVVWLESVRGLTSQTKSWPLSLSL